MYQRVCENPWDLGRQCLQDYDCPRGYACEQFCKSKDTVETSGNSTWTPWRPWENTSISRRRCFNSLKYFWPVWISIDNFLSCIFSGFAKKWTLFKPSLNLNMVSGLIDLQKVLEALIGLLKVLVTMMMIVLQHTTKWAVVIIQMHLHPMIQYILVHNPMGIHHLNLIQDPDHWIKEGKSVMTPMWLSTYLKLFAEFVDLSGEEHACKIGIVLMVSGVDKNTNTNIKRRKMSVLIQSNLIIPKAHII